MSTKYFDRKAYENKYNSDPLFREFLLGIMNEGYAIQTEILVNQPKLKKNTVSQSNFEIKLEKKYRKYMKNALKYKLQSDDEFKKLHQKYFAEGYYIHCLTKIPKKWYNLKNDKLKNILDYYPICSEKETKKILGPKNINDYLLFLRADSIFRNMRILRYFTNRANDISIKRWSLNSFFDDSVFALFKKHINKKYIKRFYDIKFGTIYNNRPNGECRSTPFGNLIIISELLKWFLYFMNIYLFSDKKYIDLNTKKEALMIAIRIMLLNETPDFESDVRGHLPKTISDDMISIVEAEIINVIGHEYAHHYLNHLITSNIVNYKIKDQIVRTYSFKQKRELEADKLAINMLSYDNKSKIDAIFYAITILYFIDIYEHTKRILSSKMDNIISEHEYNSHPPTIDRIQNIMNVNDVIWSDENKLNLTTLKYNITYAKDMISSIVDSQPEYFTFYGSMYLSNWKKNSLLDRIEY